jgi:YVTN family beta-propeller protein
MSPEDSRGFHEFIRQAHHAIPGKPMTRNARRLIVYGLFAVVVALSTLLSLGMLATVAGNSQPVPSHAKGFATHNSQLAARTLQFALPDSRFVTATIPLATGVPRWPRALAVDEPLGFAYLADGDRGTVTVVDGPALVSVIPVGQVVTDVAVDPGMGFAYASAPDPYTLFSGRIGVIQGVELITHVVVGGYPGPAAVDYQHNRAYVGVHTASFFSDQVIVLQRDVPIAVVNTPPDIVALDVDSKRGRAYVVSEAGPSLSVIDGVANAAVISLNDVGVPRDLAVDPTSGLVYVVGQSPLRQTGTVVVISDTQQIGSGLPVGADPRHVAVDPQHGLVYVTNAGDDTVTVIAGTGVIDTIDVGPEPDAIAVDPAHNRVYVSNAGDNTTTVLSGEEVVATLPAGGGPVIADTQRGVAYLAGNGLAVAVNDRLLGRLPVAAMPARLAVNPTTGLAYVCNQGVDTLNVLSGTEVLATLPLRDVPRDVAADPLSGWIYVAQETALAAVQDAAIGTTLPIAARDVALDPLRGLAYVAGDGVAVISGTQLLGTVDLGQPPRAVAVNRRTGLAYATAGGAEDGFVAVISGTERIGIVRTGGAPAGLVVDPVRDRVFVLHRGQGRLSVIEGTQRRFPNIFLPRPALDAAVNPLTGDVYVATRGPLVLAQGLDGSVIGLGLEALAVAVDVKQGVAYATTRDGQVAVLDGPNLVTMLPAGHRPIDLAIDSETGRVYVANFGSDTITVIERRGLPRIYLPLLRRGAYP